MSSAVYPAIQDLVPHGDPILMLDGMTSWRRGAATCAMTVRPDTPFVAAGFLHAVCLIEAMGQAIAACLGYEAFTEGQGVRVGMIIACRTMALPVPRVPVGAVLGVDVTRTRGNDMLSHFSCAVRPAGTAVDAGEVVASATLTVFHAAEPPQD